GAAPMTSHIIVTALICAATCQSVDVRVWDGDSVRLGLTPEAEAVRILNIDAPAIDGQCQYETDLAQTAKSALAGLLDGARVDIRRQGTDRYGRTLAALSVNGRDVGDMLVAEGLARTWSGRREGWCE